MAHVSAASEDLSSGRCWLAPLGPWGARTHPWADSSRPGIWRAAKELPLIILIVAMAAATAATMPVSLRLTAIDLPANVQEGISFPSMRQSVDITMDSYELVYWGLRGASTALVPGDQPRLEFAVEYALSAPVVWYTADLPVPLATWMHEEYHLAALHQAGVDGKNGSWLRFGDVGGTVFDVSDDELAELKASDPVAFLRSETAGLEAHTQLVASEVRTDFATRDRVSKPFLLLWNAYYGWNYFRLSASPVSDDIKDITLEHQSDDPLRRDFLGLDLTAWAYDLHHPDEPYEASRGPHPSGSGLARPIGWSDLGSDAQRFLEHEARLTLINFLNPAALGLHHVRLGGGERPLFVNAFAQHTLAPFGHVIELTTLGRVGDAAGSVGIGLQENLERDFPWLDLRVLRAPVSMGARTVDLRGRLALWLQPAGLSGTATTATPGGLVALGAAVPVGDAGTAFALEVEGKTAGWVPGNVFLEATPAVRLGIEQTF